MPPSAPGVRDDRIDALRGFALLGILLVNIQSFLYGATNPIGYLTPAASAADRAAFFATAAFFNVKFMPLFAMLFGVGFSLLYAKLLTLTSTPKKVYRRRLAFLFVFGLVHGIFFYFGDITQMYAVAGLVLLMYVERDNAGVARAARNWWLGTGLFTVLVYLLAGPAATLTSADVEEMQRNFAIFSGARYLDQLRTRAGEFGELIAGNFFGLPLTVALMLTGMLAHRAGWLTDRNARAWRSARVIGLLIGLPAAIVYGWQMLFDAESYGLAMTPHASTLSMMFSVALALFYASAFMQWAPRSWVTALAPAGRMPLSNYLLQSIAMGALLSGWGLALGPQLNYWQTSALALMVFVVQVLISRLWLGALQMKQGPLEALWRAWTYHGLQEGSTESRTAG